MDHHSDTTYAIVKATHAAMLRHAERRALLAEATRRPRPTRRLDAQTEAMRLGWLARAARTLRWVLRPAHA